jgi:PAS domain-containing protein
MFDPQGEVIGAIAIDEDLSSLRRSERAARAAHDLLERILDAGVVGVALCDAAGRVLRRNLAWNLLIGPSADADVLRACLEPDDALLQKNLIARVARGELPTYVSEHRMHRVGGSLGWTLLIVCRLPATLGEEDRVLVQVLDVDERRRNAEELANNHLRLAAAQKLAGIGDWQWDMDSGLFSCSDQMLRMLELGLGLARALARATAGPRPPGRPQPAGAGAGAVPAAWPLAGAGLRLMPQRRPRADRAPAWHGAARAGAMSMSGTLQDITERKRIDRSCASRASAARAGGYESEVIEQERKRIAREVHDELGQLLTALRMDLSMLRGQLGRPGRRPARRRMRETMVTMTEVVRHIASTCARRRWTWAWWRPSSGWPRTSRCAGRPAASWSCPVTRSPACRGGGAGPVQGRARIAHQHRQARAATEVTIVLTCEAGLLRLT